VEVKLAVVTPPDRGVSYLCARTAEMPTRWPGSMRTVPSEEEVKRILEIGLSYLPEGDTEESVRLQTVGAIWPFVFPDYEMDLEDLFGRFERSGLEAAEAALRLDRPNLASGALDAAASAAISRGLYGRQLPIQERRLPLVARLSDPLEIGDTYSAIAWSFHEIGRYRDAVAVATEGLESLPMEGFAGEPHIIAWRAVARYRLGEWDGALADFARLQILLDDRREEPPYFASHCFAAAALVYLKRGQSVEVDRMLGYLLPLTGGGANRLEPWLARLLIERGELGEAHRLLDHPRGRWRTHAGMFFESRMELASAEGRWEEAPGSLRDAREHAAEAGLIALPRFADRFEGVAASAAGDAAAIPLLRRARDGLAELGAVWECARTDVVYAQALRAEGRDAEARASLEAALAVFKELGSTDEAERATELLAELE
jgi:tetratricopeptide (TPR) repeat protein